VIGKPILFAGTGEKLEDFEPFHPDRMASRILGMGDMLTLIEKAEAAYDTDQRERAEAIVREGTFTLDDFLEQMQQVKKMGPLQNVIGMMPGIPKELKNQEIDERELAKVEAIIRSMTPHERRKPDVINGSRRSRIANGSGTRPSDVSALLKQFKQMQQMMRGFAPMLGRRKGKKGKKAPKMPISGFPGI
jgi:signal recognition particle subunit SRP54